MSDVGKQIRMLRKQKGLSQTEFGEKLGVGKTTVCSWESGNSSPSDDLKLQICKLFDVDMNYLFGMSHQRQSDIDSKLQTVLFANAYARRMEYFYLKSIFGAANHLTVRADKSFKALFHVIESSNSLNDFWKAMDEWKDMPITEWREKFEKVV